MKTSSTNTDLPILNVQDKFNVELPADPILANTQRQVSHACFSYVTPKVPSAPSLVHCSQEMIETIGLRKASDSRDFTALFSGTRAIPGSRPYAMCYGGHQFGHWAGQLGDGRAINLAEVEHKGQSWALQLKGAGETPYSRSADGLAVLRSSLREYLCSEAMHYLGVPTTRALSLMLTGDMVLRDVMYDGNPAYEKGAVVCRVSPSFVRFGNFEIFTAREDVHTLRALVDFTIKHHYAHLGHPSKSTYVQFFKEVAVKSMEMVIHWQRVGFVHGVMNTDNMSILGLTIDYGPYGWLEGYDPGWTPNTTDNTHKRYKYGTQPEIVLWNLLMLANALFPLVGEAGPFQQVLSEFQEEVQEAYLQMMKAKLGLYESDMNDKHLVAELERILQLSETDMTLFFRNLSRFNTNVPAEGVQSVQSSFYAPGEINGAIAGEWEGWFGAYAQRLEREKCTARERAAKMNAVNPKYVLRNYMAQLAINHADKGDYTLLDELFTLLKKPYDEQPEYEKWFVKRPEWARDKVGCSKLSCSS